MFEAARDLSEAGLNVVDARIAVARALTILAPEVLDDTAVLSAVLPWLEPAFLPDEIRARAGVVVGRLDAMAATAELWARDPTSPATRRLAGLALTCQDEHAVRTFYDAAARHRARIPGEFRRILRAGFAYRAVRRGDDESAREAAIEALVSDVGPPPTEPASPVLTGHPDWLAPMTRWVRDVPRDAEVDAIALGIDACLRAGVARGLDAARERDTKSGGETAAARRFHDRSPGPYETDLLRTLADWLLNLPRSRADTVIRPWLDATSIPPGWLAELVDAIYRAALARPQAHPSTAVFLCDVVGRILDDPGWHAYDGMLLHELQDRTLGVGYSGHGAEAWTPKATPLLQDLRELRVRWVERARGSGLGILWLAGLGRSPAASGARSEFAELLVRFPPAERRRDLHAQHIAAFLQCLVADSSFQRPNPAAEALLADVRAAGLALGWSLEEAMKGEHPARRA